MSHQARKRLKALIHMSTMSAIQVKGDLRDYYSRPFDDYADWAIYNKSILSVFMR